MPIELLTIDQVSERTHIPRQTLYQYRSRSREGRPIGPPSFRLGTRVVYRADQLEQWLNEQQALTGQSRRALGSA